MMGRDGTRGKLVGDNTYLYNVIFSVSKYGIDQHNCVYKIDFFNTSDHSLPFALGATVA